MSVVEPPSSQTSRMNWKAGNTLANITPGKLPAVGAIETLGGVPHDAELGAAATLDSEEFYFAVLDVSDLPASLRRGHSAIARATLDARLERFVPVRIEHLATAYSPIDESTVAACAIEYERLATIPPDATALFPTKLPESLQETVPRHCLNVLIGDLEPSPVRLLRQRIHLAVGLGMVAVLSLAWLGLERREVVLRERATTANVHAMRAASSLGSHDFPHTALAALKTEVDRLEATRGEAARQNLPRDAALELGRVLSLWPSEIDVRTDRLEVASDRAIVAVRLGSKSDLEALVEAFSKLDGYAIDVGRVEMVTDGIRVTLTLNRGKTSSERGGVTP